MKSIRMTIVVALATFTVFASNAMAQQYVLKSPTEQSTATFDGSTLVINDGFHDHTYERAARFDSRDGQFLGFHEHALGKTIRFPVSGGSRMQITGAYGNWQWSQMNVTIVVKPANIHEHIDHLALEVQKQAQEISSEAKLHYRHTPEYSHLVNDTAALVRQAAHLHELAHNHGSVNHMAADLKNLDTSFHHMESLFDRIEANAARGHGHVHGSTSHVKELLGSMEKNIHHLSEDITSLRRTVVLKPTISAFADVDNLSHRLESTSNDLLLDMHHNYSHNTGYRETYREAYALLSAAKFSIQAAHSHDHRGIQRKLQGLDQLVHHLDDDIRGWSRHHHRQIGRVDLHEKLHNVEAALFQLMDDAGVSRTNQAPAPNNGIAPPPIR